MAMQDDEDEKDPYAMSAAPPPTQMMGGLTPGTSDQAAPPPAPPVAPKTINADGRQYAFTPGANGSLTTPAAPQLASKELIPQKPLPGMPPGVSPDEVAQYATGLKGQAAKYGADNQMAEQARINMSRNSLPYRVADAGKGFADALMMGVAGAGNPNWQGQFEQQQNEAGNQNLQTMRGANEANMRQTELGMSADKMNPNSTLSKSAQQTYAPLFQKLGYSPQAIGKMSAANIETALSLSAEYGGKEKENEIKGHELQVELAKLDMMGKGQSSEMQNRVQQRKDEIMKTLAGMGLMQRFTQPGLVSELQNEAGVGNSQSPANAAGGPYGATVQKDGKTYEYSPVTQKYHPVAGTRG